jgi:hypothetical protein
VRCWWRCMWLKSKSALLVRLEETQRHWYCPNYDICSQRSCWRYHLVISGMEW